MNGKNITIAIDCMGGDFAPDSIIDALRRVKNIYGDEIKFLLYGDSEIIINCFNKIKMDYSPYEIIDTKIIISSDEKPSIALRRGKNSSMGLAIQAVKDKIADASISAGNTGALMALSKLILRTQPDVDRPALIQMIPNKKESCSALLDMGANIDCDSQNLYQFALMGSIFYSSLMNKDDVKIAILNVGSEEIKGNDAIKNASLLLQESIIKKNFVGFIEGNELLNGDVDVIVTDGFTGNVALKTMEGTSKMFSESIKNIFKSSILGKIAYLLIMFRFKKFKKKIDPTIYNGAMFIGLNGISIKSHGNADGKSFFYAIKNTINLINNDVNSKITNIIKDSDLKECIEI